LLGVMGEQELLTPVIASYLLNVEKLRVAPTLNGADVIRIEPPLIAGRAECDYALAAIERVVELIDREDTAGLLRHLVGDGCRAEPRVAVRDAAATAGASDAMNHGETRGEGGQGSDSELPSGRTAREEPAAPSGDPEEGRFAFLVHPVDLENYPEFDPSLAAFTREELAELAGRWNHLLEPFRIGQTRIVSACGRTAYGEFYVVPRTADELLEMPAREAIAEVEKALALARAGGARIVGLGAYTSVVTRGGLHLREAGVALTTGNSYTVAAAVEAIGEATRRLGYPLARGTVAVVGATGAIGRATALLIADQVDRLLLIGNPARAEQSRRRLLRVAGEICRHVLATARGSTTQTPVPAAGAGGLPAGTNGLVPRALAGWGGGSGPAPLAERLLEFGGWPDPGAPLEAFIRRYEEWAAGGDCPLLITTDLDTMLPLADVVVTATSSTAHLVTPGNVKFGAVVCDLSRPPNVSREVRDARPDVLVIDGGVIEVPGRPSMGWNFGFERGLVYACMAETMMLALEHHYQHTSLGADLNLETILWLQDLARKHGFRLAQLRSFDRPLSDEEWRRIVAARAAVLGSAAR
ncbi:MAG TPA: aminotransferase III, partial [Thermaerobacter sp.]